jgi:phospholipid/cholesterol/gamma-HCH transport system ATP-binding protein
LPDHGSVRIFDQELTTVDQATLNQLRMRIGMVFQHGALISGLSVRGNLAFPLEELTEKSPGEIDAIVTEKLEFVGLSETRDMMPHELSGGMRKRIAIARALVMEPELLLFDEPTAGLDPISGHRIDELIVRLSEEAGVTEIIIAHKLENAFRLATRVAILDDGRIVAEGAPAELRRLALPMVRRFLASLSARAESPGATAKSAQSSPTHVEPALAAGGTLFPYEN